MFNVLTKKAKALNLTIQAEGCNIQGYDGRSADFALCVFTVLNYTTEDSELVKIFSNIHKHLKDKGLFFFDLADIVFFRMGTIFNINNSDFRRHVVITHDDDNLLCIS